MRGPKIKAKWFGPFLVAIAAILWATDAPFRLSMAERIGPVFIVFFEHLVGTAALGLAIFLGPHLRGDLCKLKLTEWLAAALIGLGGSALATVMFTASFRYINPSLAILLQKLQPILVVVFAYFTLGEKLDKEFRLWASIALLSAVVLSFPDFNFRFLWQGLDLHALGVLYAAGAAALWAVATIGGKVLLKRHSPVIVTFWRFFFGLITLGAILQASSSNDGWELLTESSVLYPLLYISLIPGLAAMLAYYSGLARTPANVTTFVELLYPVSAVILNTWVLDAPLSPIQIISGGVLLFAVTRVSKY